MATTRSSQSGGGHHVTVREPLRAQPVRRVGARTGAPVSPANRAAPAE